MSHMFNRAGYKHYSSVGSSDGDMTQFDATGKKWDADPDTTDTTSGF